MVRESIYLYGEAKMIRKPNQNNHKRAAAGSLLFFALALLAIAFAAAVERLHSAAPLQIHAGPLLIGLLAIAALWAGLRACRRR